MKTEIDIDLILISSITQRKSEKYQNTKMFLANNTWQKLLKVAKKKAN